MIGEIIKEYLVSLGVTIDQPGFHQMQTTLDRASGAVSSATGGWVKDFAAAGAIIGTAVAGITTAVGGLMAAAANQDLAMEKYARGMMVSKEAAVEMKTAVDALGESIQDIQLTPELMQRYRALAADGKQMRIGGDYEGTMKNFRDLIFEFTRLKQEASYALQWVGYYLMKYLEEPLARAREKFKNINDALIKNMPVWTEKIARALDYVINVGRHFWDLLKAIGKAAGDVWDEFPRGVKIAAAALTAFFMLLRASPIGRMIMLMSTLLLLVDDYFGYMEGKQAALGPVWDKLNGYIDAAKKKIREWGKELASVWEKMLRWFEDIKPKIAEFIRRIGEAWEELKKFGEEIGKSEGYALTIKTLCDLFEFLKETVKALAGLLGVAFGEIGKATARNGVMAAWRDMFHEIGKTIDDVAIGLTEVMRQLGLLSKDPQYKGFWTWFGDELAKELKRLALLGSMIAKVFQLSWAVQNGDFKKAGKIGDSMIRDAKEFFYSWAFDEDYKAEASGRRGGKQGETTDKEKQMWVLAQQVSEKTGIKPEFVYAQWWHESAGFTSQLAIENNNFGGMTQSTPNGEENKQPDGDNYYMMFDSPKAWADYYAKYMMLPDYNDARNAGTVEEFAKDLKKVGYYGDSIGNYVAGMKNGLKHVPNNEQISPSLEDKRNVDTSDLSYQNKESLTFQTPLADMKGDEPPTFQYLLDNLKESDTFNEILRFVKRIWGSDSVFNIGDIGLMKPSSYLQNLVDNADPMLINGLMGKTPMPYLYDRGGGGTNVTYQVSVGDVNVTNTNASPHEIGRAVADQTVSRLSESANYILMNRVLTGQQV